MEFLRRLNLVGLALAGTSVLLMTVLGGADILSTALLRQPIPGVYEATETLMVLVIFLSLGYLQLNEGNIVVDIIPSRLGVRSKRVLAAISHLVSLAFFSLLTWQAWLLAWASWSIREYSVGLVAFPIYPSKFAVALGAGLTVLCCAGRLVKIFIGKESRTSDSPRID